MCKLRAKVMNGRLHIHILGGGGEGLLRQMKYHHRDF
jgi:hypothetical protein